MRQERGNQVASRAQDVQKGAHNKESFGFHVCEICNDFAIKQGFVPVVPPKRNRKNPWEYDKELYKRRNEVERYFLRIKRFRRVFTRYDKLDVLYLGNLTLAMIFDAILM